MMIINYINKLIGNKSSIQITTEIEDLVCTVNYDFAQLESLSRIMSDCCCLRGGNVRFKDIENTLNIFDCKLAQTMVRFTKLKKHLGLS